MSNAMSGGVSASRTSNTRQSWSPAEEGNPIRISLFSTGMLAVTNETPATASASVRLLTLALDQASTARTTTARTS
jgi:hypothetical protein